MPFYYSLNVYYILFTEMCEKSKSPIFIHYKVQVTVYSFLPFLSPCKSLEAFLTSAKFVR